MKIWVAFVLHLMTTTSKFYAVNLKIRVFLYLHLFAKNYFRQLIPNNKKNSFHIENFQKLNAEILELRKELRIVTGALVHIMQANGLSIDDMKKAGKEFFKERD